MGIGGGFGEGRGEVGGVGVRLKVVKGMVSGFEWTGLMNGDGLTMILAQSSIISISHFLPTGLFLSVTNRPKWFFR